MKLYIKNMLCPRCMKAVEQVLLSIEAKPVYIHLGEVILQDSLTLSQLESVSIQLKQLGFKLLENNRKQQIDKIK